MVLLLPSSSHGWIHLPSLKMIHRRSPIKLNQQQQQHAPQQQQHHRDDPSSTSLPKLILITEPDACDSDKRMRQTLQAVQSAVETGLVWLVIVRVTRPPLDSPRYNVIRQEERVMQLTRNIHNMIHQKEEAISTRVVISSDWYNTPMLDSIATGGVDYRSSNATIMNLPCCDGVHVKEAHRERILPMIRPLGGTSNRWMIGTSAHSMESALQAFHQYRPDYILVGTCYATASHPEKTMLEGPALPGQVRQAILLQLQQQHQEEEKECAMKDATTMSHSTLPKIIAIGGINESNCHEPMALGADGIAVIRAILQAPDPAAATHALWNRMMLPTQQQQQENAKKNA